MYLGASIVVVLVGLLSSSDIFVSASPTSRVAADTCSRPRLVAKTISAFLCFQPDMRITEWKSYQRYQTCQRADRITTTRWVKHMPLDSVQIIHPHGARPKWQFRKCRLGCTCSNFLAHGKSRSWSGPLQPAGGDPIKFSTSKLWFSHTVPACLQPIMV